MMKLNEISRIRFAIGWVASCLPRSPWVSLLSLTFGLSSAIYLQSSGAMTNDWLSLKNSRIEETVVHSQDVNPWNHDWTVLMHNANSTKSVLPVGLSESRRTPAIFEISGVKL